MAGVSLVAVILLCTMVGPFVLYALVRAEHDDRERMDRDEAERAVRRDTDRK